MLDAIPDTTAAELHEAESQGLLGPSTVLSYSRPYEVLDISLNVRLVCM